MSTDLERDLDAAVARCNAAAAEYAATHAPVPSATCDLCRAARTRRRAAARRPCCAACARVVDAAAGVL